MKVCNPSIISLALNFALVLLLIIKVLANKWKMHTTAKIIRTAKIGMSRNSDRFSILNGLQASSHDIAEPLDDKSNISSTLTGSAASRPWCRVSNNPREGMNIRRNESTLGLLIYCQFTL